jgi:hypothetical protein
MFFSRKYNVNGQIQYLKLIDDHNQFKRTQHAKNQASGTHDIPSLFAQSVKQKCHVLGYAFMEYLRMNAGSGSVFDQNRFLEVCGSSSFLDLSPAPLSQGDLRAVYGLMSGAQNNQVYLNEIQRYVETKCPKSVN